MSAFRKTTETGQGGPRMSGLFKIPRVPAPSTDSAAHSGVGGGPAPNRPRVGLSGNAFSGRKDAFGSTQRFHAPQRIPVEPSKKDVVGNSTRNLMDLDDTLLNAVDLDRIEQRVSGAERKEKVNRNKTASKG